MDLPAWALRLQVDERGDDDVASQVSCRREQKNTELEHLLWSLEEQLKVAMGQDSLVDSSQGKGLSFLLEPKARMNLQIEGQGECKGWDKSFQ